MYEHKSGENNIFSSRAAAGFNHHFLLSLNAFQM